MESVGLWYPRGAFQTARAEISNIEKLLAQVVFGITNLTGVDISDFGTPLPPKASVLATRTVVSQRFRSPGTPKPRPAPIGSDFGTPRPPVMTSDISTPYQNFTRLRQVLFPALAALAVARQATRTLVPLAVAQRNGITNMAPLMAAVYSTPSFASLIGRLVGFQDLVKMFDDPLRTHFQGAVPPSENLSTGAARTLEPLA